MELFSHPVFFLRRGRRRLAPAEKRERRAGLVLLVVVVMVVAVRRRVALVHRVLLHLLGEGAHDRADVRSVDATVFELHPGVLVVVVVVLVAAVVAEMTATDSATGCCQNVGYDQKNVFHLQPESPEDLKGSTQPIDNQANFQKGGSACLGCMSLLQSNKQLKNLLEVEDFVSQFCGASQLQYFPWSVASVDTLSIKNLITMLT